MHIPIVAGGVVEDAGGLRDTGSYSGKANRRLVSRVHVHLDDSDRRAGDHEAMRTKESGKRRRLL
jgi:hypothetical protein